MASNASSHSRVSRGSESLGLTRQNAEEPRSDRSVIVRSLTYRHFIPAHGLLHWIEWRQEEAMKTLCVATSLAACLISGCASYSGSSLVAGKSTAAEVEALMGQPADRVEKPGGGSALYYPRGPFGRETYVVSLGADGKVQAVEQRLTDAN